MSLSFSAKLFTASALIALTGAGCGGSTSTAPSVNGSPVGETGSAPVATAPARSACDHPFFPIRTGYQMDYRIQSQDFQGRPQTNRYSERVTAASGNTATLVTAFQDLNGEAGTGFSANQTLECTNGSLHATAYVDFGSRLMGGGAASQFRTETRRVTGDLLPRDLQVGSEWDSSFDITMIPNNASASAGPLGREMNVTVHMHRKAVSQETVTVPAGTYQAIKVQSTTDLGLGVTGAPSEPLVTTEWWVRNVGLVKTTFSAGAGLSDMTTEAERVNIPS